MYRLIYLNANHDYETFDAPSDIEANQQAEVLRGEGKEIICLVDYKRHAIFKKGENYVHHRDSIDYLIFDTRYVTNF
jgi:hypothetical protein